jgi:hypothetical protein
MYKNDKMHNRFYDFTTYFCIVVTGVVRDPIRHLGSAGTLLVTAGFSEGRFYPPYSGFSRHDRHRLPKQLPNAANIKLFL